MWPLRPKYIYRPSAKEQCFQLDMMSCVNENKGLLRCCGCNWASNMPGIFWSSHSTLTVLRLPFKPGQVGRAQTLRSQDPGPRRVFCRPQTTGNTPVSQHKIVP